jgi:hypothetical protein
VAAWRRGGLGGFASGFEKFKTASRGIEEPGTRNPKTVFMNPQLKNPKLFL